MLLELFEWLGRDIRAFKVEHWSDFTEFVKGPDNR